MEARTYNNRRRQSSVRLRLRSQAYDTQPASSGFSPAMLQRKVADGTCIIENLSLNDNPRSEVRNMFNTILYVMTILPGLDNTIMIIRVITS